MVTMQKNKLITSLFLISAIAFFLFCLQKRAEPQPPSRPPCCLYVPEQQFSRELTRTFGSLGPLRYKLFGKVEKITFKAMQVRVMAVINKSTVIDFRSYREIMMLTFPQHFVRHLSPNDYILLIPMQRRNGVILYDFVKIPTEMIANPN